MNKYRIENFRNIPKLIILSKKSVITNRLSRFFVAFVRLKGLEPPRTSPLDPKSSAATNYATAAFLFAFAKVINFSKIKYVFSVKK